MSVNIKKAGSWLSLTVMTFVLSVRTDSYITPFNMIAGVAIASCIWGWLVFSDKICVSYKVENRKTTIIAIISIIGTIIWLWNDIEFFLLKYNNYIQAVFIDRFGGVNRISCVRVIACILFALSFYGAFLMINQMVSVCVSGIRYFAETSDKIEMFYLILWTLFCGGFLIVVYTGSIAFYSGGVYNILYTYDSSIVYNDNVFMLIGPFENDIRQSLFGFFSLPISLPANFLSIVFPFKYSYAYFLQLFQDILIGAGIVLISRMLKFDGNRKIAGIVFFSVMCETVLFSLLIEQYVILVFWLIVSIYCIVNKIGDRELCAVAAVGTSPTNSLMLIWEYKNRESFKSFFMYAIRSFFKYIGFLICLGQLGLVLNFYNNIMFLMGDAAGGIGYLDRLKQYIYFVRSCFIGPASTITTWDAWSEGPVIRMNVVGGYSKVGILILIIIIISWLASNKDIFANICFSWIIFSFLFMVGIGYCAASNDMFLFVHLFGWAMGAFLLIGISKLLKGDKAFVIVVFSLSVIMLIYNVDYFKMLIEFAVTYYPLL